MGQDKASMVLDDGVPMIAGPIRALEALVEEIVIAGPTIAFPGLNLLKRVQFINDNTPNSGPLGGIEAILQTGLADSYLIAACDQPMLTEEVLSLLLSGPTDMPCFFETDRIEPFPGFYPAAILSDIREALQRKRLSVMQLIADSDAKLIRLTSDQAASIRSFNKPEDLTTIARDSKLASKKKGGRSANHEHRHDRKCCRGPD